MNCIENAWKELVRAVYDGGRQFGSISDLEEALLYLWEKLSMETIRKLISSMPRRVCQQLANRGRVMSY